MIIIWCGTTPIFIPEEGDPEGNWRDVFIGLVGGILIVGAIWWAVH